MYVLKMKKHEKHAKKSVVKNCAYDNNKAKRMVNAVIRWVHANGHVGLMFDEEERRKEMFYFTTHSTHFIYGYIANTILFIARKETCCRHMGYSFRLAARVLFICTIPQTG